jgi:hypothetical protein
MNQGFRYASSFIQSIACGTSHTGLQFRVSQNIVSLGKEREGCMQTLTLIGIDHQNAPHRTWILSHNRLLLWPRDSFEVFWIIDDGAYQLESTFVRLEIVANLDLEMVETLCDGLPDRFFVNTKW